MSVFVLGKDGQPLMPCSEKRARKLLDAGRARVHRVVPFVVRLTDRVAGESEVEQMALKIDPGSKTTGLALASDGSTVRAVFQVEIRHRGETISKRLYQRKLLRHARRRHCRYRRRGAPKGKRLLRPSVRHRLENIVSWARRVQKWAPVSLVYLEDVRFEAPDGLHRAVEERGLSLTARLARRDGAVCAYCGSPGPFQADHVVAKSRGGVDAISNRVLACVACNRGKGAMPAREFPGGGNALNKVRARESLRDSAAVNAMRIALPRALAALGVDVVLCNPSKTAEHRRAAGLPKRDAVDALVLGLDGRAVRACAKTLRIESTGRGSRRRVRTDRHGRVVGRVRAGKRVQGFATGDVVRVSPKDGGMPALGRVAIRANGDFNVRLSDGRLIRASATRCELVQRADGYRYTWG